MSTRGAIAVGWVMALGVACTGAAPLAEVPSAPEAAPEAPVPRREGGKAAKRGKRADVAGCPEGVVAAPSWPGEWPAPVVDVTKAVTVPARPEPCSRPSLQCDVPVGLYHPWSQEAGVEYVTVRAITRFEVVKEVDVDELHLNVGDTVEVMQVFGEGYCGYRVAGKDVTAPCPELLGEALKQVGGRDMPDRQLFSVSCGGGRTGWVEADDTLLARPEVRLGTTPEFGEVGPGTGG